jgi:hypothetical protein
MGLPIKPGRYRCRFFSVINYVCQNSHLRGRPDDGCHTIRGYDNGDGDNKIVHSNQ